MAESTKPPAITEAEIIAHLDDKERLARLSEQVATLRKKVENTEATWLVYLELGARVPKRWIVKRVEEPMRAQPSWKTIALDFAVKLGLSPQLVELSEQKKAREAGKTKPVLHIEKAK